MATLKQRLFFNASFTSTPSGNFPNANPFLSAKDLSAEGSINEVPSTAQQFHQAKLPSAALRLYQKLCCYTRHDMPPSEPKVLPGEGHGLTKS